MNLEIKGIGKSYKQVEVLKNLDLSVNKGEFIALKGASGSGKSTLLAIVGGMLKPDEGQVLIDGQDLYSKGEPHTNKVRAASIGFLFQEFHLVPYLSVLENILAPTVAVQVESAEAKAMELIQKFGLENRKDHKPSELSTGEMQRCALARALISSPDLLLADEPTGNLDDDNSDVILESLTSFASEGGIVLMATHDSRAAEKSARIINISKGQIDE